MATALGTHSTTSAAHKAYQVLHVAFFIAPLIAGVDKFFDKLVDWDKYLAPIIASHVPAHTFMLVVGAVEIVAAFIVLLKPRIGAWIVMLWLWGIVVNLLIIPGYFDIALRDFGLSLGAMALGFISADYDRGSKQPS